MTIQHKQVPVSLKSFSEAGQFTGYASVFDVVDSDRDVVQRGAFRKSLLAKPDVKLLWQHQSQEPIGAFNHLSEDAHGLYVEGRLLQEVQRGREALALLKSGALNGLSIGYRVVDYTIDEATGYRLLHEIELVEISLVTFPANPKAVVRQVKAQAHMLLTALEHAAKALQ